LKADDIDVAPAAVRFSNVFADAMVLQRNKPIHLWGFGPPPAGMTVCLGSDCTPTTTAAETWGSQQLKYGGRSWSATLPARAATTTSMTLTLRSVDNFTLQELYDIVVGDVFLFSGQSNIDIPQTYGR
jgi:sialate O-acetylesterase